MYAEMGAGVQVEMGYGGEGKSKGCVALDWV